MVVEKTQQKRPVPQILEEARQRIVHCMKQGKMLVLMCENAVPDFSTTLNDDSARLPKETADGTAQASFPLVVFEGGGSAVQNEPWPQKLFRKEDLESGLAIPRDGFSVIVTTRFKPDDFEGFLLGNSYGLPKPARTYQAIEI